MRTSANLDTTNIVTLDDIQTISGAKTFSSNITANGNLGVIGKLSGDVITGTDGSASSPSISFNGNATTGFFKAGTNIIGVTTNGVERVRIDASGVTSITGQLVIPTVAPASPTNGSIWIT